MSACSVQAMSQVGCRLMVASSANTSRPFAPGACGDIARALATKAAMSSDAEAVVSGNAPDLPDARAGATETSSPDFRLVGSRGMLARKWLQAYVALACKRVNAKLDSCDALPEPLVWHRLAQGDRPWRIGQDIRYFRRHRRNLAVVAIAQKLIEHALNGGLDAVRTGVTHVVMLEAGVDHGDAGLLADVLIGHDARISLEDGIRGAERENLEFALGHEGHAQIVQGDDLLHLIRILLGEIHRDVTAHRMSDHGDLAVVGIGLDFLHLLESEMDVGYAALNLRQPAGIELADLCHHRRVGRQIVLRADRQVTAHREDVCEK